MITFHKFQFCCYNQLPRIYLIEYANKPIKLHTTEQREGQPQTNKQKINLRNNLFFFRILNPGEQICKPWL